MKIAASTTILIKERKGTTASKRRNREKLRLYGQLVSAPVRFYVL